MSDLITTTDVCAALGLTEPALRHVLRRPGVPRPALHPTARVFLWTEEDVKALRAFLAETATEAPVEAEESALPKGGAG